jgi:hypothetical protein
MHDGTAGDPTRSENVVDSWRSAMSQSSTGHSDQPGRYEIRIKGRLEPRWAAWFEGMQLAAEADGTTVIVGAVADQAALQGLLRKVSDMGVQLISVTPV